MFGRITGSDSLDTLVRVGIAKNSGEPQCTLVVLHDFQPCVSNELCVHRGQIVHMIFQENDWMYVMAGGREGFVPQSYCAPLQRSVDDFLPNSDACSYVSCPYSCSCSEPCSELLSDPDNDHDFVITEDAIDDLFKQTPTGKVPRRRRPIMHRTKSLLDATIGCLGCLTDDSDASESVSDLEPLLRDILNAKLAVDTPGRLSMSPSPVLCSCGGWSLHKTTMQHNCEQILIDELFADDKSVDRRKEPRSRTRREPWTRSEGRAYRPPYLETLQEEDSDCYTLPRLYPIQRRNVADQPTYVYNTHIATPEPARECYCDDRYIVLFAFGARQEGELELERGDFVTLLNDADPDWWLVKGADDNEGFVPSTCLFPARQPLATDDKTD